jgi:hypothetical protein
MVRPVTPPSKLQIVQELALRAETLGLKVERFSSHEGHLAIMVDITNHSKMFYKYASSYSTDWVILDFIKSLDFYQYTIPPTLGIYCN